MSSKKERDAYWEMLETRENKLRVYLEESYEDWYWREYYLMEGPQGAD